MGENEKPNVFCQTARVLHSLVHNIKEPARKVGLPESFQGIDMAMIIIREHIGTELQYLTPACRETVIQLLEIAIGILKIDSLLVLQQRASDTSIPISNTEAISASMAQKMEKENRRPCGGRDEMG